MANDPLNKNLERAEDLKYKEKTISVFFNHEKDRRKIFIISTKIIFIKE